MARQKGWNWSAISRWLSKKIFFFKNLADQVLFFIPSRCVRSFNDDKRYQISKTFMWKKLRLICMASWRHLEGRENKSTLYKEVSCCKAVIHGRNRHYSHYVQCKCTLLSGSLRLRSNSPFFLKSHRLLHFLLQITTTINYCWFDTTLFDVCYESSIAKFDCFFTGEGGQGSCFTVLCLVWSAYENWSMPKCLPK